MPPSFHALSQFSISLALSRFLLLLHFLYLLSFISIIFSPFLSFPYIFMLFLYLLISLFLQTWNSIFRISSMVSNSSPPFPYHPFHAFRWAYFATFWGFRFLLWASNYVMKMRNIEFWTFNEWSLCECTRTHYVTILLIEKVRNYRKLMCMCVSEIIIHSGVQTSILLIFISSSRTPTIASDRNIFDHVYLKK